MTNPGAQRRGQMLAMTGRGAVRLKVLYMTNPGAQRRGQMLAMTLVRTFYKSNRG